MFRLWDTYTTKDKILQALCEVPNKPGPQKIDFLCGRFPDISREHIISFLWHLDREKFVSITEINHQIAAVKIHHSAHSYLVTKYENRFYLIKWDLIKIGIGFVLGWVLNGLTHQ